MPWVQVAVDHGPFARLLNHDLRGRNLSRDEKLWLGTQQNRNLASAVELALRYNLKEDTVRRYAMRLARHRTIAGGPGRPRGSKDSTPRKTPVRKPRLHVLDIAPVLPENPPDDGSGPGLDPGHQEQPPALLRRSQRKN